MDLRSFKIHGADKHVRVVLGDHRGERARDLYGEIFEGVLAAAGPLLRTLAARAGAPVRALSVDGVARVLRLTTAEAPPRPLVLVGQEFAGLIPELMPVVRAILAEVRIKGPDLLDASPSDAAFWEYLYRDEEAAWDLGRATPPLVSHFNKHSPNGLRALVVGCGRGHDARMLAELGAKVTAIDLSTKGIAAARGLDVAGTVDFRVADLFKLSGETYDLVVEHTCFCAIDPGRRDEYVDRMADALVPGGALVGLFFAHGRPGGPPFTTDAEELRRRFGRRFAIRSLAQAEDSVLMRAGQELLGWFVRMK